MRVYINISIQMFKGGWNDKGKVKVLVMEWEGDKAAREY